MSDRLRDTVASMSDEQIAGDVTFLVETINKLETEIVSLKKLCRTCAFCGTEFQTAKELKGHCGACEPHPLAQENRRLWELLTRAKEVLFDLP